MDGSLKCWGYGSYGSLGYPNGYGNTLYEPPPENVDLGAGRTAKSVTTRAASNHICVILDNDTLKCYGNNDNARLGYGDTTTREVPDASAIDLGSGKTVTAVSVAYDATCAVLNDGSLKCFGNNEQGQLGIGSYLPPAGNLPATADLGTGRTATDISQGLSTCVRRIGRWHHKVLGIEQRGEVGTGTPGRDIGLTLPTQVSFDGSSSSG